MRDLLEALKQDLGVQSSRSKRFSISEHEIIYIFDVALESNTYASVHRAAKFDNDPLPPPVPQSTRDEALILMPNSENRRLSYDLNAPFPWQIEEDTERRPSVTPRKIHETPATDLFNDDQRFTPTVKPRTLPQPKSDELPTLNFNKTIRKTIDNDLLLDWGSVTPVVAPVPIQTEENNKDEDDEEEISRRHEEEEEEERARTPPLASVDVDYGGDDFEEEDSQ